MGVLKMNYEEKTISREAIYKGNIINVENVTVTLPDGREATRDIVLHPGASVIMPLSEDGCLYMVRQFRKPLEAVSLELPAGKLDQGEDPRICAERELREETGLTASNIIHLLSIHTTPGFSNEVIHLYAATGLTEGETCADEDEFISSEKISVERLVDMVLNGGIKDAKTIIGVLMAEKVVKGEINIKYR
jgi:ADP-ribose pyrophosphatase